MALKGSLGVPNNTPKNKSMTMFSSDFLRDPANYSGIYVEWLLELTKRYPELAGRHELSPLLLPVGIIFTETPTGRMMSMKKRFFTLTKNAMSNVCMRTVFDLCIEGKAIGKCRRIGKRNTPLVLQCLKEFLVIMKINPETVAEKITQLREATP